MLPTANQSRKKLITKIGTFDHGCRAHKEIILLSKQKIMHAEFFSFTPTSHKGYVLQAKISLFWDIISAIIGNRDISRGLRLAKKKSRISLKQFLRSYCIGTHQELESKFK